MKKTFNILILLIISQAYCQAKYVSKAEKMLKSEKPNKEKVLQTLDKAKKEDYGLCGLGIEGALNHINYLTGILYYKTKEYEKCLKALDSITYDRQADSLKVRCLVTVYGKEKVFQSLQQSSANKTVTSDFYYYNSAMCLNLEDIKYKFCFYDQNDDFNYKEKITIWEIIEHSNFFPLIVD